ncbi:membrane-targeted effector domain-containing toxin [Pseudomonas sp. N40(2020)]|uniref:membrane-targeted effector domain-containing toxin n=1 Tax=Pseudomonas sp. N40(2020) TaxID=2767798 RepID=UPI0016570982|nr:membrane-targeted effector domain-containing toxin [Pseudomonas sp. N40(2020)]MBC8999459.1 membrane-targeted effector domain-containing toxin [Pseudomonas sp. N40(2020)]
MKSPEQRPLPNAADKESLKAIAATVVQMCPSLHDEAHQVAREWLARKNLTGTDPDRIYFHRFKTAQSSTRSFTGWEHIREKPYESMTLTQLVIHRFRATDQDNADLLDLYAGFYTDGPETEDFDHNNEFRLHGNEVLNAFWDIDFSTRYTDKLTAFWNAHADDFRTLAKSNFLSRAVQALDLKQLTGSDFQWIVGAVIGSVTWPVTLAMLQSSHAVSSEVRAFDIDGHVATDLLRFVDPMGRQIVYLPGEATAFVVKQTPADEHWWVLEQMNNDTRRQGFLSHFPLAERQQMNENITDLMNRLVSTWGHADHHLINRHNLAISGDAFSALRDATRSAMFAEASLALTSNGDLRKKLWIGYLSAGLKVFGPMAAAGWPIALPVIGASIASTGLNIDQVINGKTTSERKAGVLGAVLSGIDALFNIPFLKGTGSALEVGAQVEAAEAAEMADLNESASALEPPAPLIDEPQSSIADEPPVTAPTIEPPWLPPTDSAAPPPIPDKYMCNELLDGLDVQSDPGQFQGIFRLDTDPPFAILMNDNPYYVRYFGEPGDGGYWAIVDPERPNQFVHSLPVRLNAEGAWERMKSLRLRGGGQCMGKPCAPDIALDTVEPIASEASVQPEVDSSTEISRPLRIVNSAYDIEPTVRRSIKGWALNLNETHAQLIPNADGSFSMGDPFERYALSKRKLLQAGARKFFSNLPWITQPPRPPVPVISAQMSISDLVDRIFESASGLVVGETLDRIASMRFMIENMPALARHAKTLYLRGVLSDFAQVDLNRYFTTGTMSADLQTYLTSLGTDPAGRFNALELVKAAKANGVRIQGIDCAASYKMKTPLSPYDEQMIGTYLASDIMTGDTYLNSPKKWIVLIGAQNTNTLRGLAGISEIKGGIGVRIEEVGVGTIMDIDVDPGIEVRRGSFPNGAAAQGNHDVLRADLRVRMPAEPMNWTEDALENLLHRRGMFIINKIADTYTVVHRSKQGILVRTRLVLLADGGVSLHRPSWPQVNDIRFASIEAMSNRLIEMGLTLQSRLPD